MSLTKENKKSSMEGMRKLNFNKLATARPKAAAKFQQVIDGTRPYAVVYGLPVVEVLRLLPRQFAHAAVVRRRELITLPPVEVLGDAINHAVQVRADVCWMCGMSREEEEGDATHLIKQNVPKRVCATCGTPKRKDAMPACACFFDKPTVPGILLDVGCPDGVFIAAAIKLGRRVLGITDMESIDASAAIQEYVKANTEKPLDK